MEHFGRRVCGGASLHGIFAPGRAGRDSRRTLSIYRLVLVEQRFSRPRPRFEDISTCGGMDALGILPPAWIHSALSPSHQPPDPVYGLTRKNHANAEAASSLRVRKPSTISLRSLAVHKTGVREDMVLGLF